VEQKWRNYLVEQNSCYKKQKIKTWQIIVFVIALVLLGCILYFAWPLFAAIGDPEQVREMVVKAGAWGPLVFILLQVIQVFIAPIPGQMIGLAGGYLFGPFWGIVYITVGATIGFTLIFFLTRKLGRPFIECIISPKALKKFDHLTREKGVLVFFLIFLLPAFPDDIISFIAGLTTIRIRTLVLISLAGRLPGYIMLCLAGNGLAYKNINYVIAIFLVMAVLFSLAWWKRKWLQKFIEHNNRILLIKEQWKSSKKEIILWGLGIIAVTITLYMLAVSIIPRWLPSKIQGTP